VVDHYIDIPNGLGVASVGVKGIVSCVDVVEVNISVKENISPERIGKVWAVSSYNEVVFGMSDVNEVVCLEEEHLCNIHIEGS